MDLPNIHIGTLIKEKLTEKSMSIAEFSRRINRERTTVYDIFQRKSIDIDLLIKISEALEYDFIHEVYYPKKDEKPVKMVVTVEIEDGVVRDVRVGWIFFFIFLLFFQKCFVFLWRN